MPITNLEAMAVDYQRVITLQSKEIADGDLKISILKRMVEERDGMLQAMQLQAADAKAKLAEAEESTVLDTGGTDVDIVDAVATNGKKPK